MLGAKHLEETPKAVAFDTLRKRLPKKIEPEVKGWQGAQVLTDDEAPVELAWDMMAVEYVQ